MLRHVSTSGTDRDQQAQFDEIHKWMLNAGGISDRHLRADLEYQARSNFNASAWKNTVARKQQEDMLVAMWIETYDARCQQYLITIEQVTAAGNLVKQVPHMPPVSGEGIELLESLKDCREILKTRLEQYRWSVDPKKREKVKRRWSALKNYLKQQWDILYQVSPERADQFSSQLHADAFRIERVLESKDVHKAIFQEMEQVGREMAALIAHVERGTHASIQSILDLKPTFAAQYANIPDDTALYYIGMITLISVEKIQLVFSWLGIDEQRTMEQWRLEPPPCTEAEWYNALPSLNDILEPYEVDSMYPYMVKSTEYA